MGCCVFNGLCERWLGNVLCWFCKGRLCHVLNRLSKRGLRNVLSWLCQGRLGCILHRLNKCWLRNVLYWLNEHRFSFVLDRLLHSKVFFNSFFIKTACLNNKPSDTTHQPFSVLLVLQTLSLRNDLLDFFGSYGGNSSNPFNHLFLIIVVVKRRRLNLEVQSVTFLSLFEGCWDLNCSCIRYWF